MSLGIHVLALLGLALDGSRSSTPACWPWSQEVGRYVSLCECHDLLGSTYVTTSFEYHGYYSHSTEGVALRVLSAEGLTRIIQIAFYGELGRSEKLFCCSPEKGSSLKTVEVRYSTPLGEEDSVAATSCNVTPAGVLQCTAAEATEVAQAAEALSHVLTEVLPWSAEDACIRSLNAFW